MPELQRIYTMLLALYPESFRREFGDEMIADFEEARRETRRLGQVRRLRFVYREITGLLLGLARERPRPEAIDAMARARMAPLTAGTAVGVSCLTGAVLADGAYLHQPVLYAAAGAVLIGCAFQAGAIWSDRAAMIGALTRTTVTLLVVAAALPAARLADHLSLRYMADTGGAIRWSVPGVDVEARTVTAASAGAVRWEELLPTDRRGLIHSGSLTAGGGTRLVTVWHRHTGSPPYELLIVLTSAVTAMLAHAWRGSRQRRLYHGAGSPR